MLMPILTVKTPVATPQAALVVEALTPKERVVTALPQRISGNQSGAALKILEALNRHLVGSDPLPKEALVRLLDTLSKILKFPPLPQETLRDFSKRLAVFLETLPPAARLALEKELLQRNLAVSIRVLAEALKSPPPFDAPRLLEKLLTSSPVIRNPANQPEGKPPQGLPAQQGQATVPGRQPQLPAAQALVAAPALAANPGLLQAALKRAFSDDDMPPAMDDSETDGLAAPVRRDDQPAKTATPRGTGSAAASAQPQPQGKANSDTIPLLRAAAAFLAADPEALSLVSAITAGNIDSRTMEDLTEELGLDLSGLQEEQELQQAGSPLSAEELTGRTAEPEAGAKSSASSGRSPAARQLNEVDGFKGHDLGEWELEATTDARMAAAEPESRVPRDEALMGRLDTSLAQTLKALAEATLPLPGGAPEEPDTLFATLAGEAADMGADILFAQLDELDAMPDMALVTGDIGGQAEALGLEADAWSTMLDGQDEKTAARQALAPHSGIDEQTREAQTPRLPDTGIVRDAVTFAMIPYLPAQTPDKQVLEIQDEDEEKPAFAEDEAEDQHRDNRDQPEDSDDAGTTSTPAAAPEDGEGDTGDAYDFYRRMGGLG
jgi:hypothetical protein